MPKPARDRFDDIPRSSGRVGAHRAERPRMNGWVVLLWAAVIALVLAIAGIFTVLVTIDRISLFPDARQTDVPVQDEGVIDTSYTVFILNSSGVDQAETQMRGAIMGAGWAQEFITTGPGDELRGATTVFYATEADKPAAQGLANVIGGAFVEQGNVFADSDNPEQKQLLLVIGEDRASDEATE